jgi:hypothetical protein
VLDPFFRGESSKGLLCFGLYSSRPRLTCYACVARQGPIPLGSSSESSTSTCCTFLQSALVCMQVYKARDKTKLFWIEHYKHLLDTLCLLGSHTLSLTPLDARLLFLWSQSVVRDELKSRQRAVSLVFCDFVEVCRASTRFAFTGALFINLSLSA